MSIKTKVLGGALAFSVLATTLPTASFAAENTSNFNTQKKAPAPITQTATEGDVSAQGWKTKLAAQAIRKAGWLVSKLGNKISPKASKILSNNLNKIANWIEKAGDVQEWALASFLVSLGIPPGDAAIIAHWIVLFFGL
ncbi:MULTISPECIES: hypothetical protein [Bacillus]|uniref:hypothetical protein n=1 Tax=Bacillus TaxID=1386 RepID=UPI0002F8AD6E|nr:MULTISPECIES: hypothetical protein [Bacillus]MBO1580163.1 hypothetical protein [Bacillus sp. XF8]MBY0598809.1 hypothetical protein [Bacillus bingmayongensis]